MIREAVIILGSARSDGDTARVVANFKAQFPVDSIDLNHYVITPYDYLHKNKEDDFLPLIKDLIDTYSIFIFATPVYWYSMSAQLKIFIDRFTDLLTLEKPYGRLLAAKKMAVISCSIGSAVPEYFYEPFKRTAAYLKMDYTADIHIQYEGDQEKFYEFWKKIEN